MSIEADIKPSSRSEALAWVTEVARSINEFRDMQRWALVQAGEGFVNFTTATAIFTYLLLALALIRGATVEAIAAAAAYYLVGSCAGLFKRLQAEAESTYPVDDYNFSGTRVWRTPVLSGLAAVGGIVMIALLPGLIPAGSSVPIAIPSLAEIFDLSKHPEFLVIAAIFGLTPGLLIGRLQQLGDQLMSNLSSTQASTS
jgi:hypothetical protein